MMNRKNTNNLLLLFIPIFFDLLLTNLFSTVDSVMLVKYDLLIGNETTHLCETAVATAGQAISLLTILVVICSNGVSIVVGQYLGASREDRAKKVLAQGIFFNTVLGIVLMGIFVFFSSTLLKLAKTNESFFDLAKDYLSIYAYALPFMAISSVISANFRAYGKPIYVTIVSIVCNGFNVLLNYLFIYGVGPFPELGVKGAAIGTVGSFVLMDIISLILNRIVLKSEVIPRKLDKCILRNIVKIGLPSALENFAYTIASFIVLAAVNSLVKIETTARGRINMVLGYIYMFSSALAAANSIIVARYVGQGKYDEAKKLTIKTTIIGLAIIISLVSLLLIIQRPLFLLIDSKDEAILGIIASVLPIVYMLEIGRCINLIVIQGQKAAGDVIFPLILGLISMFIVMALGSWIFAIWLNLGLFGVFLAQALDEFIRAMVSLVRWFSNRWQNKGLIKNLETKTV